MNESHGIFAATGLINCGVTLFGRSYDLRRGPPGAEVGYRNPALLCLVKYPGEDLDESKCSGSASTEPRSALYLSPCGLLFSGQMEPHFIGEVPVPFRVAGY